MAMKTMPPTKILDTIITLGEGQMETRQVYRLLQWVIQRNKEMVEKMVRLGVPDLINRTEPIEGVSALHRVSAANDLEMARFLLSQAAHPDIQDKMGRTAMMLAAEQGHVDMVELLASHQADGTLVDTQGKGLLFYCISPTKSQLVEMALEMGADVNNVSNAGKPVFMFACEQAKECENICMRLLEKGADPNVADPVTGSTPLLEAVKAESVVLVRAILQRGGNPNAVDRNQQFAAQFAASKGLFEVLRMLSAYSADFNLTSVCGDTALHAAAAVGHAECCRFLFQRGCCVVRNRDGLIPNQIAKLNGHRAALKELIKANQAVKPGELPSFHEARLHDWSLEHKAVLMQAFQSAEEADSPVETVSKATFESILLEHHAPVDNDTLKSIIDVLGGFSDQIDLKEFFMGSKFLPKNYDLSSYKSKTVTGGMGESKAAPPRVTEKIVDMRHATPISLDYLWAECSKDPSSYFDEPKEVHVNISQCVKTDDYESLKLAFSQCVPVDSRDRYYKTPLMTACIRGNYQMARFLISQKANVNVYDQLQWTCLHHACFAGHAHIVKLLLQHSAIVDATTSNGVTPLMTAIQSCRPECVKLLLKAGANIEATNKSEQTCELLAQLYGNKQIRELIESELENIAKLKQTTKSKKDTKEKQTPKKKEPPKTKETPKTKESAKNKSTPAKEDATSAQKTTGQTRIIIALNRYSTNHCVTLPSLTIWGRRVPVYRRLQNRNNARLDYYEYKDKMAISLESTVRIQNPPNTKKNRR